jgi:hypothetical protein
MNAAATVRETLTMNTLFDTWLLQQAVSIITDTLLQGTYRLSVFSAQIQYSSRWRWYLLGIIEHHEHLSN